MTEIEKKALALVNKVRAENRGFTSAARPHLRHADMEELEAALCRAIEHHEADKAAHAATVEGILKAHEAYKQEVSDAVEDLLSGSVFYQAADARLRRFIIPKPTVDPLVEIVDKVALDLHITGASTFHTFRSDGFRNALREALAKRGLKIVEDV